MKEFENQQGLYQSDYEHDACGVGMIVNIHGEKSHTIIDSALKILEHMKHRGAEGADKATGDGAGIMLQIPHEFILLQGIPVPEKGKYGTGLIFLPQETKDQEDIIKIIKKIINEANLELLHIRDVPVNSNILGETARSKEPRIIQIFITDGTSQSDKLERDLYIVRKQMEKQITHPDFYVVSLSSQKIVYKGMLSSTQ